MSVDVDNFGDAKELFEKLSHGGQVHHNLRKREWGHFGRCTDKYGINCMVNCDH